jgi:hypothetical protein
LRRQCEKIFSAVYMRDLWVAAATRFTVLEDIMRQHGYREAIHMEIDNILYGNVTELNNGLRQYYPQSMAITPLIRKDEVHFVTASFLWIPNVDVLTIMNDFFIAVSSSSDASKWTDYLTWLKKHYSGKRGGVVAPDPNGVGVKPFAINEMSLLAYFHKLHPTFLQYLPLLPDFAFTTNRHIPNVTDFVPGGNLVGPRFGAARALFDSGSYGQYLGGTHMRNGENRGFTDPKHIIGVAMRISPCRPLMLCTDHKNYLADSRNVHGRIISEYWINESLPVGHRRHFGVDYSALAVSLLQSSTGAKGATASCHTAPFVTCDGLDAVQPQYFPLYNLHIHSKRTLEFISRSCVC